MLRYSTRKGPEHFFPCHQTYSSQNGDYEHCCLLGCDIMCESVTMTYQEDPVASIIMAPWGWWQQDSLTDYTDSHPTKHCSRHTIIKRPATEFVMQQQQQEWSDETPVRGTSNSPVLAHLDCRKVWSTGGMKTSMWDTKCFKKNLLQCHLSTTNPIRTPLDMKPHLGNGKFVTDCLGYKITLGHVVYARITLHQCNTSYKITYTDHINQQTGIMMLLPMCPRWHQFRSSNFKRTLNVHTTSHSGMFRSLHSRPFTDGNTMQFTVVPLVTVHNFACIVWCSYCCQSLLLYFLEGFIFMFTLILLNLSGTHYTSFSPWQIIL